MNREMTKSELLSRYVADVKRKIGLGAPKDVDRELESLLSDSIEARETAEGRELRIDEVAGILREFGTPGEVAERYLPRPRHLIGPGLYPVFMVVVKAVLGAAALVPLILLLLSRLAQGEDFPPLWTGILNWLGLAYQIAFGGLAWAVLVFAVLERLGVSERALESAVGPAERWNPLDLPPTDDPSAASRFGTGFNIYAIVALLIVFNFWPEWIGIYTFKPGSQPQVLSLRDLGIHLPMWQLNLWWLVALIQNLLLFRAGRWTEFTRWTEFGLGLFGAAIIYLLIEPAGDALRGDPFETVVTNHALAGLLARLVPVLLTAIVVIVLAASTHRLYRLLRVRVRGRGQGATGPVL